MMDKNAEHQPSASVKNTAGKGASCPCCMFLSESSLFLPYENNDRPTSSPESVENDSPLMSPLEAFREIQKASACITSQNDSDQKAVLLVDTHGHAHLEREQSEVYSNDETQSLPVVSVVSLTCAVEESDWKTTLEYASKSDSLLPGLGVHPWYLADLSESWLHDLEELLVQHPAAVVGEIGLCKMARFIRLHPEGKQAALAIQRQVFKDQMKLAAKLKRPVSVHCVKQHGVFMNVLDELFAEKNECDDAMPPVIGMHSFTGTANHIKDILDWEKMRYPDRPSDRPLFYFGFSHAVNFAMCSSDKSRRHGVEAVCAVPLDRILAESDVHNTKNVATGTAGAVAYIAWALGRPIKQVAELTALNGIAFLSNALCQK